MKSRVVLAYAGGIHASAAIPWLIDTYGLEVVTVTVDVGQEQELGDVRARAIACGATRAHVVDARDEFARDVLLPSLLASPPAEEWHSVITALPRPIIARKLIEVAGIEGARTVAHGSNDAAFDAGIAAIDSTLRVIAPAREWAMSAVDLASYAHARHLPVLATSAPECRVDQNLWGRVMTWDGDAMPPVVRPGTTARATAEEALVDIHFERGVPTSINRVPMSPAELIECLSLIAGQHGIGRVVPPARGPRQVICDAPAAVVLHAAASVTDGPITADVCLRLVNGQYTVLTPHDRHSLLVNYA